MLVVTIDRSTKALLLWQLNMSILFRGGETGGPQRHRDCLEGSPGAKVHRSCLPHLLLLYSYLIAGLIVMKTAQEMEGFSWESPFSGASYDKTITEIKDIGDRKILRVCCTQLLTSPKEQKRILDDWQDILPALSAEYIKFWCHVPQCLINAIGRNTGIKGIEIKWTRAKEIKPITGISSLEHLSIWEGAYLVDIHEIQSLPRLRSLHIGGINHTSQFDFLKNLLTLEILDLRSGSSRKKDMEPIDGWIGSLKNLRSLRLQALGCPLPEVTELVKLKKLENLCIDGNYDAEKLRFLRTNLPALKYDQEYYNDLSDWNCRSIDEMMTEESGKW
jgi:hypothetical protein